MDDQLGPVCLISRTLLSYEACRLRQAPRNEIPKIEINIGSDTPSHGGAEIKVYYHTYLNENSGEYCIFNLFFISYYIF